MNSRFTFTTSMIFGDVMLGLLFSWPASGQQSNCLQYEPNVVQISGTIYRRTFPGPPNYENVSSGDSPETYWFLKLPGPACVLADSTNELSEAETNVTRIQLVLNGEQYSEFKNVLGKKASVSGTLFHAITGHHHTKVLLRVESIRRL